MSFEMDQKLVPLLYEYQKPWSIFSKAATPNVPFDLNKSRKNSSNHYIKSMLKQIFKRHGRKIREITLADKKRALNRKRKISWNHVGW